MRTNHLKQLKLSQFTKIWTTSPYKNDHKIQPPTIFKYVLRMNFKFIIVKIHRLERRKDLRRVNRNKAPFNFWRPIFCHNFQISTKFFFCFCRWGPQLEGEWKNQSKLSLRILYFQGIYGQILYLLTHDNRFSPWIHVNSLYQRNEDYIMTLNFHSFENN